MVTMEEKYIHFKSGQRCCCSCCHLICVTSCSNRLTLSQCVCMFMCTGDWFAAGNEEEEVVVLDAYHGECSFHSRDTNLCKNTNSNRQFTPPLFSQETSFKIIWNCIEIIKITPELCKYVADITVSTMSALSPEPTLSYYIFTVTGHLPDIIWTVN